MLYWQWFRLGFQNPELDAGIFFGKWWRHWSANLLKRNIKNGKSYQEAAITSLPKIIVLTWLEVHILSIVQSSAQMLPLAQSLGWGPCEEIPSFFSGPFIFFHLKLQYVYAFVISCTKIELLETRVHFLLIFASPNPLLIATLSYNHREQRKMEQTGHFPCSLTFRLSWKNIREEKYAVFVGRGNSMRKNCYPYFKEIIRVIFKVEHGDI